MELDEVREAQLRRGFRILNRNMLLMWRLGLGRLMDNPASGYIMVLTTTGRRSGDRRRVPLNYTEVGASVFCLAGFGRRTHWLLNLEADSACEIWLPDGRRLRGDGELVADEGRRIELVRAILQRSGFAARLAHPELDLAIVDDEVIAGLGPRHGVRYEIVEVRVSTPVTGPGGPGDLTWVWPAAALFGTVVWLTARRWRRT